MLFRRTKKSAPDPTPPWLKWAIFIFLACAVLSGLRQGKPGAPNPLHDAVGTAAQQLAPQKLFNFSDYKSKVFPDSNAPLRVKDGKTGSGPEAVCGQQASIAYQAYTLNGAKLSDAANKEHPLVFRIGGGEALPAFDQTVIGMRAGGERFALAQPVMAYGAPQSTRTDLPKDAPVRFAVTLLSISPPLPDSDQSPYRIAPIRNGSGPLILCGMSAKVQVTIWGADGRRLYASKDNGGAVSFTPGHGEVFSGLEEGVVGMAANGSQRTLIVPPAFQQTLNGKPPAIDFLLPKNETVVVDVETVI